MNIKLREAAELVSDMSHGNWNRTFPASGLEFNNFGTLVVKESGNEYEMLPSAQRLISARLRLPQDYLMRCPPDLQAQNLNFWLRRLEGTPLFCRFNERKARAFFTPRYKPIDNVEIMAKVLDAFDPELEVELRLNNEMMVLNLPDYGRSFAVHGDPIMPGTHFGNSEVGFASYSCSVFYVRIVCTNGLIATDQMAVKMRHVKMHALDDFEGTMREVKRLALYQQEKIRISIESKVDDPQATIASFGKQYQLSKEEITIAQAAWEEDPKYTLWNVIQAFTWAAKNEDLPAEVAYRFQKVGGQILALAK
jgi:hypothetical protein